MAVDALGNPLRQLSKRKRKLKHFIRSSPDATPSRDITLPPTPGSTAKSDPIVSHTIAERPIEAACHVKRRTDDSPGRPRGILATESPLDELQDRFIKAQYDIADLRDALHKQSQRHMQEKLFLKQDMMLDMLRRHELSKQTMDKLMREKHILTRYASEQKKEAEQQKKKAEEEIKKHDKAKLDLNYFKNEAEHLQTINKVIEEDLDELRQIENEDAAQRKRKTSGLPPAYGSLDDEDRYLTPQVHEDSGSLHVAVFKRAIRSDFMQKLMSAHILEPGETDENGNATTNRTPQCIFYVTSCALSDACQRLKVALEHAENVLSTDMHTHAAKAGAEGVDNPAVLHIAKRCIARRDFVAERVARMILDLGWRVVSASELRPYDLHIEKEQRVRLNLAYKEVDECMIDALRQMFTLTQFGIKKDSILWEYQHYFTQVTALRRAFINLSSGTSYPFFSKTYNWLEEQVETERMNQANRSPEEQAAEGARPDGVGGSEVSSEVARSGNESPVEGAVPVLDLPLGEIRY